MTERKTLGPSPVGGGPSPSQWHPVLGAPLSPRQLDMLRRTAMGQSWTRIGRELGISKGGVGSLSKQVLVKLGARNSAQAVDIGHRLGLLGAEPDTDRGRLGAEPDLDLPQVLLDVLRLLVVGHTNAEIARLLGRSENTVIDQVLQIRRRLGARDRAHAAALAVAMRLVHLSLPTSAGVVANGA